MQAYIVLDPQHEYAVALIDRIHRRYGLEAICIYRDRKAEFYGRRHFPELRTGRVAATYFASDDDLPALADALKRRYAVAGVIPHAEWTVSRAATLIARLGLGWNDPAVLARFRDKHALKQRLRQSAPTLRQSRAWLVREAGDVFAQPLPERFVLKPNDGMGNTAVATFAGDAPRAALAKQVEAHLGAHPGRAFLLEEFIAGTEYAVNGQVDATGKPLVLQILRYQRGMYQGADNLQFHCLHVHTADPAFAPLAAYAARVIAASGLRRSPFHVEIKIDAEGPCLIEAAARFGGTFFADLTNDAHGGALDVFDLAAHDYLFTADRDPRCDWNHYDRVSLMSMNGFAPQSETIVSLEGVREIERMPEFLRWVIKPMPGAAVTRTTDLFSLAYGLHLRSLAGDGALFAAEQKIRETLRWNGRASPLARARVRLGSVARKAALKARWALHAGLEPIVS